MTRFKLTVEYDGGCFHGFQRQEDGVASVQQSLEEAILAFCGEEARIHAAGRTDAGVHALGQVCHFDLTRTDITASIVQRAMNFYLTECGAAVVAVEAVDTTFHARFSARSRHYRYEIINRSAPSPLEAARAWHVRHSLNDVAMHDAAQILVGRHDFTTFRATQCQAQSAVRNLTSLDVIRINSERIHITTSAPSFLHHQVRNMVGSLVMVGMGKWTSEDLNKALQARSRAAGGPTAPAHGLYFTHVYYV